jgi:hypothetical protein
LLGGVCGASFESQFWQQSLGTEVRYLAVVVDDKDSLLVHHER